MPAQGPSKLWQAVYKSVIFPNLRACPLRPSERRLGIGSFAKKGLSQNTGHPVGDMKMYKRKVMLKEITDITARRSLIRPDSLFNLKSVNPQPGSGSVAKDMTGKIQVHVFRQSIRRNAPRWCSGCHPKKVPQNVQIPPLQRVVHFCAL
eukprot:1155101-Pelagomonas_calceolata.AAC.1